MAPRTGCGSSWASLVRSAANLVACCRPCNDLFNRAPVVESVPSTLEGEGFNNPDHAARRYSWIRPPSTFLRSTSVGVVLGACGCLLYTSDAADEEDSVDLG